MKLLTKSLVAASLAMMAAAMCVPVFSQEATPGKYIKQAPAVITKAAQKAMMLGAARSGKKIIAVGDHGVVLVSDDGGASFRQAKKVPTRATLTSVSLINEHEGWAAGHWGVILHTLDGGETWVLQHDDLGSDRPLFSVWFKNAQTGYAAGLWSLLLTTNDGGKTWTELKLPASDGRAKAEKNLFRVFPGPQGELFIAAERGALYRSADEGQSWSEIATGNAGTFWTGISLKSGTVLVAGLRGKIYRSSDDGAAWHAIESGTLSSITDMTQLADGRIVAVGLDGVSLQSKNDGESFELSGPSDQVANTAVVTNDSGGAVVFNANGIGHSIGSSIK